MMRAAHCVAGTANCGVAGAAASRLANGCMYIWHNPLCGPIALAQTMGVAALASTMPPQVCNGW